MFRLRAISSTRVPGDAPRDARLSTGGAVAAVCTNTHGAQYRAPSAPADPVRASLALLHRHARQSDHAGMGCGPALAAAPLQDVLNLGNDARMNQPAPRSTCRQILNASVCTQRVILRTTGMARKRSAPARLWKHAVHELIRAARVLPA